MYHARLNAPGLFFYICTFFLLSLSISAQESNLLVINNVTIIDGTDAEPLQNSILVIEGEYIKSVSSQFHIPAKARVIDGTGMIAMPGIVDMHTHPTFEIRTARPRMPFPDPAALPGNDEEMSTFVNTRLPKRLKLFLERGITSVISAGGYWPYDIEVQKRLSQGDIDGPRLLVASPIFTAPGGHPASGICSGKNWCASRLSFETADPDSARAGVRKFAAGGVQAIKIVYDSFDKRKLGGPNFDFPRLDLDVVKAIVDEAHSVGLPVIVHTKTVDETADVLETEIDALVHSALMENADFTTSDGRHLPSLIAARKLSVTTTVRGFHERLLSSSEKQRPKMKANFDLVGPSLKAYQAAGITLMFGTDFDGAGLDPDPGDAVKSEARALVAAGFSNKEVIQMATGNASNHPMVPDNLGQIKKGMLADVILLDSDPLKEIEAITRPLVVIKQGRVVVDKR